MNSRLNSRRLLLLATVLIISTSGLAYELIAGTMATYLLGQSVTQFSFATGWFMAAMGFGSYLTRYIKENLFNILIDVQIVLAVVGGYSALIMFLAFAYTDTLYPFFLTLAFLIGTAVGFEIPVLLRIIGKYRVLSLAVSDVFTFDYIGALFASIAFPLFVLPYMGLIRSSMLFGIMNLSAAFIILSINRKEIKKTKEYALYFAAILLILGFIFSGFLTSWIEGVLYQDPVVTSKETKYQRIVITKWKDDTRLFLNGNLQFSSRDEARYHESLVHIPITYLKKAPETVVVLGGGDGLVIREVLKYPTLKKVILVELDQDMIQLFKEHPFLKKINDFSLSSRKLEIVYGDAFHWMKTLGEDIQFDLIISDLPDPNSYSLSKLYTVSFYLYIFKHLKSEGIFVTQATSATFSPGAFWCINNTIQFASKIRYGTAWKTLPYHTYVPSFGDWGFIMTSKEELNVAKNRKLSVQTRFLNDSLISGLFQFSKDILPVEDLPVNKMNDPVLVKLYSQSWHRWYQ
ncbi:MAG: polyamine aminopropyltransferase [Leptospiraceae bacterium]|nr:polyamine aminopropyltransferase [Leptospiraceae bacterium]MCP5498784.1 polyamine aminopropyltransferase [Leptospiraceae bacterium]